MRDTTPMCIRQQVQLALLAHARTDYELQRARTAVHERGATFARQRLVESLTEELARRRVFALQVIDEAIALSFDDPREYQRYRAFWSDTYTRLGGDDA